MPEDTIDSAGSELRDRTNGCIERGIAAAQEGDLDTAVLELTEAERLADELDAVDLVGAARINRGYAYWVQGDVDAARRLYAEAAEIARDNDDTDRLKSALLNFGVASRQIGRWEEAVVAYDEYLTLVGEEPADSARAHLDCGLSLLEVGDSAAAMSHMEEAERIAKEAGLTDLEIAARIDQGVARERIGDRVLALDHYRSAAEMAREVGSDDLLATAVLGEAHGLRQQGDYADADPLFTEAEDLYRVLGNKTELANTLYWHALTLKNAGSRDRALAIWREEETIRRELEQYIDLGDCLLGQAGILRERDELFALETAYMQAENAYRRASSNTGLAEVLLHRSRLLRTQGKSAEALELTEEALQSALQAETLTIECRVRGLRAMLFAELGRATAARDELDSAESTSMHSGLTEQSIWTMARRAYVMAHDGESAEEVVLQLRTAHLYGVENGQPRLGRRAALRIIGEIKSNCDVRYLEPLDELRGELRSQPIETESVQPSGEDSASEDGATESE